jgi:hypothetical protein
MDRFIKEFEINEYTYKLGYNLYSNKVYPRIEIYKNNKLLSGGYLNNAGAFADWLYFYTSISFPDSDNDGYVNTIKEMFTKLKQYNEIPQMIEEEFENIFLLYKLNNFKKL